MAQSYGMNKGLDLDAWAGGVRVTKISTENLPVTYLGVGK